MLKNSGEGRNGSEDVQNLLANFGSRITENVNLQVLSGLIRMQIILFTNN
jgi:hypothetical protein